MPPAELWVVHAILRRALLETATDALLLALPHLVHRDNNIAREWGFASADARAERRDDRSLAERCQASRLSAPEGEASPLGLERRTLCREGEAETADVTPHDPLHSRRGGVHARQVSGANETLH